MLSNRQTDTHTDPTTVTLAAHARRGLISGTYVYKTLRTDVQCKQVHINIASSDFPCLYITYPSSFHGYLCKLGINIHAPIVSSY